MEILNELSISKKLPKRPKDANKGTFGKVLVIAGSQKYPGAAYLCCASSYRVGAGLVTLVSIPSVCNYVIKKLPEVTLEVVSEKSGVIDDDALNTLSDRLGEYNVILLGPGLTNLDSAIKFVKKLFEKRLSHLVIDGDGLNILSKMGDWWNKLKVESVLTPHPGEMARLTGLSVEKIQKKRKAVTKEFATKWGQVVVLKGANTVIASQTGEIAISPFANPALATAGTGDVLSGCIAGFLAQGLSPIDAACCGVYVHGMAGELFRKKTGNRGMLASDLLSLLPKVLVHVTKHRIL